MTLSESVLKMNEKKLKWLQLLLLTNRQIVNRIDTLEATLKSETLLHCNNQHAFLPKLCQLNQKS